MRVVAQNYVGYFWDDSPIPFSRIKWRDLGASLISGMLGKG